MLAKRALRWKKLQPGNLDPDERTIADQTTLTVFAGVRVMLAKRRARADRIRKRLGDTSGSAFEGDHFPPKPKRMRWITYRRLEEQYEEPAEPMGGRRNCTVRHQVLIIGELRSQVSGDPFRFDQLEI